MPKPSRTLLLMLMTLTALGEISTQLLLPALGELERVSRSGPERAWPRCRFSLPPSVWGNRYWGRFPTASVDARC